MSFLPLAGSALLLGFLHGLGADHLMAIAALAVEGAPHRRRTRAIRTAVGFACGHAVVLGAAATLAVTAGLIVPGVVSTVAERAGGAVLLMMGAFGLWQLVTGQTYGHIHGPSGTRGPGRWHLHLSRAVGHPVRAHGGSVLPIVVGAFFAASSLRAVMLLEPFTPDAQFLPLPRLLVLIALFGVGVLLSMSIFGVLLARVLSSGAVTAIGRAAGGLVAVASMLLGLYWMVG